MSAAPQFDSIELLPAGKVYKVGAPFSTSRIIVTADSITTGRFGLLTEPCGQGVPDLPVSWTVITSSTQTTLTPSGTSRWVIECITGILNVKATPGL
jgi:hypothetical protein